jgi:hypothetical protein
LEGPLASIHPPAGGQANCTGLSHMDTVH